MEKIKKIDVYLWAILLIVIEQITKLIVIDKVKESPITIIKGILSFSYCENTGVAFSIGDGHVPVFIILSVCMIVFLVFFYEKYKEKFSKLSKIFFTIVIAGGASNLIDRIVRGFVVDFIDVNGLVQFAIFNVADIFVVIGIFGLAITTIIYEQKS